MEGFVEIGKKIVLWFSSPPNRLRLKGARIEVIALLLSRNPQSSILLAQSPYHSMWMPPQEGVGLTESFEHALVRCLEVECGLDIPKDKKSLARMLHIRSIKFLGIVELPRSRHGERPVADDAVGTPLESVVLKRKAYWVATVLVAKQDDLRPKADGREVIDFKWYSLGDARDVIGKTNHADKAKLLTRALDICEKDLQGAPRELQQSA